MLKAKTPLFNVLVCGPQIARDKILCQKLAAKFQLSTTVDQKKALKIITNKKIDLVVLEILTEDLEILQLISSQFPAIAIIVVNAGESKKVIARAFSYGARDVFAKPLDSELLVERLEGLLRSRNKKIGYNFFSRDRPPSR